LEQLFPQAVVGTAPSQVVTIFLAINSMVQERRSLSNTFIFPLGDAYIMPKEAKAMKV